MSSKNLTSDYDAEPVMYCASCYSLKIKYEEVLDADCCQECGCSDIRTASIKEWESLYEHRYGHKYAVRKEDPKKTLIYSMPLNSLKAYLYDHPAYNEIIHSYYPKFPGGIGKIDTILLFFDKIIKDGLLNSLRNKLIETPK
jgi:hypothetical protein